MPASGAWRPGDPPGERRFVTLRGIDGVTSAIAELGPVTVAYETWGRLAPAADNAVLIEHALTADSHAAGPAGVGHGEAGWWDPLIGPGRPIDTDRWFVVCPNVLGGCQGSTGPSSADPEGRPWGSRFPTVTARDQVAVEAALASHLGVGRWVAIVGGSMGGMRALEWAIGTPERVERLVLLATTAAATPEQIALCAVQNQAIRLDPAFLGGDYYDAPDGGGPHAGLGLARRIGHVSYRSERELAARFGRDAQAGEDPLAGGRYAVESYLDHQAEKLARRFDANSYLVLSESMNHHDVGRGRGGIAQALSRVTAEPTVIGIDSDRLYPLVLQQELCDLLPGRPKLAVVSSPFGHDGFLLETGQVGELIAGALAFV